VETRVQRLIDQVAPLALPRKPARPPE